MYSLANIRGRGLGSSREPALRAPAAATNSDPSPGPSLTKESSSPSSSLWSSQTLMLLISALSCYKRNYINWLGEPQTKMILL